VFFISPLSPCSQSFSLAGSRTDSS